MARKKKTENEFVDNTKIIEKPIIEDMEKSYLDYSMSVIAGRALPDVRDGAKPIHRRIIYGMSHMGVLPDKPYKKSARIVGDVMGKYHPHGDSSIYEAMVRMAQDWNLRYPLVDGHGNFGSIDGDGAAASRYCVVGDTLVNTSKGLKRIEDIVEKGYEKTEEDINITVQSFNNQANKAIKFFNSGMQRVIKMTLLNNYSITGSLNHPVLVLNRTNDGVLVLYWKQLQDITIGDYVAVNRNYKVYSNYDKCSFDFIDKLLDNYDNISEIPTEILESSRLMHRYLICHLFDRFGTLIEDSFLKLELVSKNLRFLNELQVMLLEFGISCNTYYDDGHHLIIQNLDNLQRFYDELGFISFAKNQNMKRVIRDCDEKLNESDEYYNDNYFFFPVIRCKTMPAEVVYSIKVASKCHSFVTNGIVSHNTEARMSPFCLEMVRDINKETVDFVPNFDGEEVEPTVLPSRIPNLLVNGATGIAVGMTTNIPPHNLGEIVDACVYMIDTKKPDLNELMKIVKGPDFPTGGLILGKDGIREMYETGQGKIKVRSKIDVEDAGRGKHNLIVSEIPYNVNKAKLVEKTAQLVKEKKISEITEIRDESSREGLRVFIEIRKDADPDVVLNKLYKYTDFQTNFAAINLALVDGVPKLLRLDAMLSEYIKFQKEVIKRRTEYDLKKARERAHILAGLLIALDNIDEVIKIIRTSTNNAKERLMKKFKLTDIQAQAILDMRLARLQKLEAEKLRKEYTQLQKDIARYEKILKSDKQQLNLVKQELLEIKEQWGDKRKTKIVKDEGEIEIEDIIQEEDCFLAITAKGFVNRLSSAKYDRKQGGSVVLDKVDDYIKEVIPCNTKGYLFGFTDTGKVYKQSIHMIDESRSAQGINMRDMFGLLLSEKLVGVVAVDDFKSKDTILMVSSDGQIKRMSVSELDSSRKMIQYTKLRKDAVILKVWKDIKNDILLTSSGNKTIRFSADDVREMGKTAVGVNAMTLGKDESVVDVSFIKRSGQTIFLSTNGFIKRIKSSEFKKQSRAGKGNLVCDTVNFKKYGIVKRVVDITDDEEVFVFDSEDKLIQLKVKDIPEDTRTGMGGEFSIKNCKRLDVTLI